jgi:thioredoxin 1
MLFSPTGYAIAVIRAPLDTSPSMATPQVLEIRDDNFADLVTTSPVPVLVDFTAVWCPPCKAIAPHVEAIAGAHAGRLRVGKVDADAHPDLCARYDVRGLPTLLLFDGGQVIGQITGAVPRARIDSLVEAALARKAA